MKKKDVLLSILLGVLFLFGVSNDVFAEMGEKTVRIYTDENDGYVTSWVTEHGNSEELWNLTHDTSDYLRMNDNRSSIEIASGWSSDSRFFIHRARVLFDLPKLDYKIIDKIVLNIKVSHVINSLNDGNDFISLVQASSTGLNEINYSDYQQIGESLNFGWGNAYRDDIIEISNRIDITDISIGDILEFKLTKEFIDKMFGEEEIVLGLREGHDLLDLRPVYPEAATANNVRFYSMDKLDEDLHPYLEITYTTEEDEETKDPLILIPGILGSWPVNGELALDPMLNTYENLWNALIASGYEANMDLFAFPYEWRNSNVVSAETLAGKIEEVKALTGSDKVDLVAHSMGGLVAREYLSDEDNLDNVDQLIFLATPHRGAPNAYLTWEGGKFGTGFTSLVKEQIFIQEALENNYDNIYDYIRGRSVASVKELLPVFNYLRNKNDGELRLYPDECPKNELLEKLNEELVLGNLNNIDVLNLVALGEVDHKNTLNILEIKNNCGPVGWEYGCPKFFSDDFEMSQGDGTVPERSNYYGFDFETYSLLSSHSRIVTDAQQDVIERLTGERPSEFIDTAEMNKKMLLFQLFSPVDMQIRNEAGEILGKDFVSNQDVMDIGDSYYSGFENSSEFASILSPEIGIYNIDLQGTADGEYKLVISYITEDGIIQEEFIGIIRNGQIINLFLYFSEEENSLLLLNSFEKTLKDLEDLNEDGEIKDKQAYKFISKKLARLNDKYLEMQAEDREWKRYLLNKYIGLQLNILKGHLKFHLHKEWISQQAYNVLTEDVQALKDML